MINTQRVAVFNRIEQLQEDMLDKFILAKVPALVEDLSEEVTVLAIVHNDVCEIFVLDDTMEGNDIGVSGGEFVEANLTQVQLATTGRSGGVGVGETFHGVRDGDGGSGVEGTVNDSITALTEQFYELQRTVVDEGAKRGGRGQGRVSSSHRKNNVRRGGGRDR